MKIQLLSALSILIGAAACSGLKGKTTSDPDSNPIQAKYIERVDASCKPKGELADLINGPYQCFPQKGAEQCAASFDAVKGTLSPGKVTLFGDLLKRDAQDNRWDEGFLYAAGCPGVDENGTYSWNLAIGGLGYAKAVEHLDVLIALSAPEIMANMGGDTRASYISALGRFGAPHKEKILPALRNALTVKGTMLEFKENALKLMALFESDDGVGTCLEALKQGAQGSLKATCSWYLGERKHAAAAEILIRSYNDDKENYGRALGLLGAKEGIAVLKAAYEKDVSGTGGIIPIVALLNLGDTSYDYAADLALFIEGKRPLSLREREQKAKDLAANTKGAAERWKTREDVAAEGFAKTAAIESTFLTVTDAAVVTKIHDALKAVAGKTAWVEASGHATSALAQRGEQAAVAELVAMLASPKKESRKIALGAFGSRYDAPKSFLGWVGRKGVVADATVPPALLKYIENESDDASRIEALQALGAVRSFL